MTKHSGCFSSLTIDIIISTAQKKVQMLFSLRIWFFYNKKNSFELSANVTFFVEDYCQLFFELKHIGLLDSSFENVPRCALSCNYSGTSNLFSCSYSWYVIENLAAIFIQHHRKLSDRNDH